MFEATVAFIRKRFRQPEAFIPLHAPVFEGNEENYLVETIRSTFVSSVGAFVDRFEEDLSKFTGAGRSVAVVNGTAGLHVALHLTGVNHGDEVITQALTFVATANAIAYAGAQAVFLDVDRDTMGLSPDALQEFLEVFGERREDGTYNTSTGRRLAACVPMHTFGFPARIEEIARICSEWSIPLVEDAAESLGAKVGEKHTGLFGTIGTLSFNGNKTITSGGGGALIFSNPELGALAKYVTNTAKKPHPYEYFHDRLGFNYRMPNLNAALACAQLEQLPEFLRRKRILARAYKEHFDAQGIHFRTEREGTTANYWLMCLEMENREERDGFLKSTNESGVMTRPIWELMNTLPMYSHCQTDGLVHSRYLVDRIVNIPSSPIR